MQSDEKESTPSKEPIKDITTWVFEAGTFVPTAKIQDGKQYSIVSDYLGTPIQMYDEQGNKTWDCTLDIYGKVLTIDKGTEFDCPFRFQGQYVDKETGLYYNRLRYYISNIGIYISQDPLIFFNSIHLYSYVHNVNTSIDILGLFPLMNGATVTVTATSNRGIETVTKSSGGGLHAEINALRELNKKGALNGADVVISDVVGHFPKGEEKAVQVCAKCRHDIFQELIDGKANSITIPRKGGAPITIMKDQFETVQNATGEILEKYEGTKLYKKRSDESFEALSVNNFH